MATAFNPSVFTPSGGTVNYQAPVAQNQYAPKDGMSQLNDILNYQGNQLDLAKKQALLQPSIEAGKAASKKEVLSAEQAGVDLNQHYANIARGTYGGLLTDPDFINGNKEAMKEKLNETKNYLHKIGVPEFDEGKHHDDLLAKVDEDPRAAYQTIKNGIQQAGTNPEQFAQSNRAPTAVSTGQGTQFVPTSQYQGANQNQFVQGQIPIGTELTAQPGDATGLPPGTKYLVSPNGNAQPVQQQSGQSGVTPQQMANPANQQQPQQNAAVSGLSPQVSQNLTLGNNLVNASRLAASTAPNIDFAANQAIKLADVTDTGTGSALWNTLKGRGVALPDFDYANPASNYDKLGHVLAQQNALLAQNPAVSSAMQEGAVTNKKLDLASSVAGTTNWTSEGIKYAARTNRALADMSKLYSKGVEQSQVISNNNPLYANQFQSKWNSLVNVDSIRLANAYKNKEQDPQGYTEMVKELGGKKSKTFQDTASRIDAINELVTRGK